MVTVKLSLPQKQSLYHELGQFLRSGIPLPQAVEALAPETGQGPVRKFLERMQPLLLRGESIPGTFAQLRPAVGDMEVALIDASNSSGRLEQAFAYLSGYFGALESVRAGIVKRLMWPLIQLHIGVLLMTAVQQFVANKGVFDLPSYLAECAKLLGVLYGAILILWLLCDALVSLGRTSASTDTLLGSLPILGRLRRNMALTRFCAVYEMQLQAGINAMDGLRSAADASGSARIRAAIQRIIPKVRDGSSVSAALGQASAFPAALLRTFRIGEDTGSLDEDLRRWADYYHKAALSALEAFGTWLARVTSVVVLGYVGYLIIVTFQSVLSGELKMME